MAAKAVRPFKLTSQISETSLQEAVAQALDLLLLPPAFWAAYPSGHIALPPAAGAALMRCGLKRGIPDLLLWFEGRTYGIELKLPGKKLSKDRMVRTRRGSLRLVAGQDTVHPRLQAAGLIIGIAHSIDEVLAQCRAWGLPIRNYA